MTALPPIENRRVVGLKDGQIKLLRKLLLNPVCAHPECDRKTDEAHHCFPRSTITNDSWYVEITEDSGEKKVLPHVAGLCREHHRDVEEHRAWIRLEDEWNWYDATLTQGQYVTYHDDADYPLRGRFIPDEEHGWSIVGALTPQPGEVTHPPKKKRTKTAPKDTKQINLAAPTEEMEAFLALLEECRVLLERPETTRWKFYTALEVVSIFVRDASKA